MAEVFFPCQQWWVHVLYSVKMLQDEGSAGHVDLSYLKALVERARVINGWLRGICRAFRFELLQAAYGLMVNTYRTKYIL